MKRKIVKRYTNDVLTVVWKPHRCIHSTNCFKALPGVFDPKRRPWIDPEAAPSDQIKKAIDNCPSRALSYELNDKPGRESPPKRTDIG